MSDTTKDLQERGKGYVESFKKLIKPLTDKISKFGKDTKAFISSNAYTVIGATGYGVIKINEGAHIAANKIQAGATAVKDKTVEVAGKVKAGATAVKDKIVVTAQIAKEVAGRIKDNSVAALNNAEARIVNGAYKGYNKLVEASASIHADYKALNMYAHNAVVNLENAATTLKEKAATAAEKVRFGILKTVSKVVAGVKVAIAEQVENVRESIINVVQKGLISVGVDVKPEMMALPNGVIRDTMKYVSAKAQEEREAGETGGWFSYFEEKYQELLANGYKISSPEMKQALGHIYVTQMQGRINYEQRVKLDQRVEAVHAKSIAAKKEGQAKQVELAIENSNRMKDIADRAQDTRDSRQKYTKDEIQSEAFGTYQDVMNEYQVKEERFKEKWTYKSIFPEVQPEQDQQRTRDLGGASAC